MAERRVQVERLRPSAKLQAVARPVETYVRPAEQPVGQSDLGAFISAIAPAAETMAKLEREKQLKLQREAERGIASARAFDAKLGASKALRAAYDDFANPANSETYLNMTTEEVRDKRAEIMQPFFDKVQQSGDDKLALAFQQDIELGNLDFFTKVYDPEKRKFDLNNSLSEVFTEVLAIQNNPMLDDDLKLRATDELLKTYQKSTGTPWNAINQYAVSTTANRVTQDGRTALYKWLEKEGQLGVAKYQDTVRTIDTRLAAYDTAQLKLGKDAAFQTALNNQITSFLQTKDIMSVGGEVTFKDGTTRTITDEDIITALTAKAVELQLTKDEAIKQLFRPFNIVPTEDANAIMSGKYLLTSGDITDENVQLVASAYMAYKTVDGYGFTIKDTLMSSSEKKLMRAMDYLIEKRGVGPEGPSIGVVREALTMVRGIDPDAPTRKASQKEIQDALDRGITDISDFDEAVNRTTMLPYIQEGVDVYMQLGASLEEATKAAVADARKDFIILEDENTGTKHVLPILNTAIDRTGREAINLQRYITESMRMPEVAKAVAARGGAGLILTRTTNPKMLNISVIDENGLIVGNLRQVPVAVAQDPETVRDMIAKRVASTLQDDEYITGGMGVVVGPIEVYETEETVAAGTPTLEARGELTPIRQVILPEGFDVATVEPITRDGEFTGDYLYKGTLPDGSQVTYISPTNPEKAIPPEARATVPTALEDMAAREAQEADEIAPAAPIEKPFLESLREDVNDIRSVLQKTFGYEKIDADAIMSETIDKMIPVISDSAGGVGEFFDEAYKNTKMKLTNNKAIIKAREILDDFPELISELQLDVRGLFARGKAKRGITVKEQATIARSIIAVNEASEKQYNVETQPQLDEVLGIAAQAKNTTPDVILNTIIKPIAFHESDGTLDPNLKQYGDGPARGLMQYEPDRFKTSINRAVNYYKKLGQETPAWITEIDVSGDNKAIQKEITSLSGNQQMALAVLDLLEHPKANIGAVVSGQQSIEDFWANYWWAGADEDRSARIKAFRKSFAKYQQE